MRRLARVLRSLFAVALLAWPPIAAAQAGATAKPTPTASSVPRIPAAVVERLLAIAAEQPGNHSFLGIHKFDDDTSMLSISSGRQTIAFAAASAAAKGGKYTPPPEMRLDLVHISCGDADLGERWDCGRINVLNALGRRVAALTYNAGPAVYRNALGSKWSAITARATYRLADLVGGFSVQYAGTDGTEFTERVSSTQVNEELLAELPPTSSMRLGGEEPVTREPLPAEDKAMREGTESLKAEPLPPEGFAVAVTPTADGWEIVTKNPGFTWRSCELVVNGRAVNLGDLPPESTTPVALAAFKSAAPATPGRAIIRCTAQGRVFQGPVPDELAIRVQSGAQGTWSIVNLTDWAWTDCVFEYGESRTRPRNLTPNATVLLSSSDFAPPSPTAATSADKFSVSCEPNGRRVVAVKK